MPRFSLIHGRSGWSIYDAQQHFVVLRDETMGVADRVLARLNGTGGARPGCPEYGEPEETADDYLHAYPER